MNASKINGLNKAITEWFLKNTSVNKVPAKELMPHFIQAGIFTSNQKDGLPIRKLLRELDKTGELKLIPAALAERKSENTNWFFIRINAKQLPVTSKDTKQVTIKKQSVFAGRKASMRPIADKECKILILGSLPGEVSLEKGQYYANKNNHFWEIMNTIYGGLPENYEAKCNWLLQKGIAVWDVVAHAEREGSVDSTIKYEQPNDFVSFFRNYPKISKVFFNGTKAQQVYQSLVNLTIDKTFVLLPSSSSARAMRKEDKVREWKQSLAKT
jgi:TDG/mug DNA glycosylase family protein